MILATGYAELPPGDEVDAVRLPKPFAQADLARAILQAAGPTSACQWMRSAKPSAAKAKPCRPPALNAPSEGPTESKVDPANAAKGRTGSPSWTSNQRPFD